MKPLGWARSWAIARRDLHHGFRGLRLLFICLLLGVATLAAIGSLTAAITSELAARGQTLLGGDVEVAMTQREATPAEVAALRGYGQLSETIRMRAMAQRTDGDGKPGPSAILTELKGIDQAYPLYGALMLGKGALTHPLADDEILIGRALADRLDLSMGETLRYGSAVYRISDIIADEPDRVGEGFTLGPVALVSLEGLRRTGLLMPGSLYESKYRIRLTSGADAAAVGKRIEGRFPSAGWEVKDRDRAAPGANRFFERMGQFLSLIGLAALVIAGIGISNGVSSYLTRKRDDLATLKVLGATSADIARIYMLQIGLVTVLAMACGLAAGALLPPVLIALAGDVLPVRPGFAIHALPLLTSALYGMLIAFIFTLPPLARARTEPAAALFRAVVERPHGAGGGGARGGAPARDAVACLAGGRRRRAGPCPAGRRHGPHPAVRRDGAWRNRCHVAATARPRARHQVAGCTPAPRESPAVAAGGRGSPPSPRADPGPGRRPRPRPHFVRDARRHRNQPQCRDRPDRAEKGAQPVRAGHSDR